MWGNPLATTMPMESQSCALGKVVMRLLFAFKMSWLFTPILPLKILNRIKYIYVCQTHSQFSQYQVSIKYVLNYV